MNLSSRLEPIRARDFIRYQPSGTDKTQLRDPSGYWVECCGRRAFQSSLPDLIRQSMQRTRSHSVSVPPHTPDITMDHRVKPGGDAVGSVWSILCVEWRVAGPFGTFPEMNQKYMSLYFAEFQFRYGNRFNADIFGAAISGC